MKMILIKLSGKVIEHFIEQEKWIDMINILKNKDISCVFVHGAGEQVTEWSSRLGIETVFYKGQRISKKETMDVVLAVQSGLINSTISAKLNASGVSSCGLSGISFGSFIVNELDENLGYVGFPSKTEGINTFNLLIKQNVTLVFSTVCMNQSGHPINVNADIFTVKLSEALHIKEIYILSDINAVLVDNNETPLIYLDELKPFMDQGNFTDGMIPKIESVLDAFNNGVENVWIGNSNPENIINSVLKGTHFGTRITRKLVYA